MKIIEQLSNEKAKAKKFPVIVLDSELSEAVKKQVLSLLRELWKEEKIDFGRTINNNFVEIRTPETARRNRKVILHEIH